MTTGRAEPTPRRALDGDSPPEDVPEPPEELSFRGHVFAFEHGYIEVVTQMGQRMGANREIEHVTRDFAHALPGNHLGLCENAGRQVVGECQ